MLAPWSANFAGKNNETCGGRRVVECCCCVARLGDFLERWFRVELVRGLDADLGLEQRLDRAPPFTSASLNITPGGTFRGFIRGVGFVDPRAPTLVLPRVGNFTAQVNHETQAGGFMSSISQQDVITNADRDAADNLLHVRFSYAAVLNDSGHADNQRPFFFVRVRNITKSTTLFEDFTYEQQPGKTFLLGTRRLSLHELHQRRRRRAQRRPRRHAGDPGARVGLLSRPDTRATSTWTVSDRWSSIPQVRPRKATSKCRRCPNGR